MEKQLIISISREYGSGGHHIAELLAERFMLPLYDHNLLDEIAKKKNVEAKKLKKYDERMKIHGLSRRVRGFSNSPEEAIAQMQFDYLREKAESGESFVVVGRCSESILQEFAGLIPIFVTGDKEVRIKRIEQVRNLSEKEAIQEIIRRDRNRRAYHNQHCAIRWGDSRNYDICINSSRLGPDGTADYLESYIRKRIM